jgi:hypothetical protein
MQPGLTLLQPRTGFHVASVHSIFELALIVQYSSTSSKGGGQKGVGIPLKAIPVGLFHRSLKFPAKIFPPVGDG